MEDHRSRAPLAALRGAAPEAPAWFTQALKHAPERAMHDVEGARIETVTWGERGRPGLLFLHGNGAHADWWSFIAPFFARDHRVAALSWSGMGGSEWRTAYSLDLYVEEALRIAEAAGLFEAETKPVFVGHSFGGFPLIGCAARRGKDLRAAIVVDTPFLPPERVKEHRERRARRGYGSPTQIYPTLAAALARFRLLPAQPCDNLFIVDFIARMSLKEISRNSEAGFVWRFDPFLWQHYRMSNPLDDLRNAGCPIAIIRGECSVVMTAESAAFTRDAAPADTPLIEIPDAYHHVMLDQPLAFVSTLRALLAGQAFGAVRRATTQARAVAFQANDVGSPETKKT
jgi:pimeloyl-ACP methyl ester carboxylesterase